MYDIPIAIQSCGGFWIRKHLFLQKQDFSPSLQVGFPPVLSEHMIPSQHFSRASACLGSSIMGSLYSPRIWPHDQKHLRPPARYFVHEVYLSVRRGDVWEFSLCLTCIYETLFPVAPASNSNWYGISIAVGVVCALLVALLIAALYFLRIRQKKGK